MYTNSSASPERTVLLFEAYEECRSSTDWLLSVHGFTCQIVDSIEDIIEKVGQHSDSLILADYRYGDLEGDEMLRRLHNASIRNRVIMMSSYNDESLREKSLNAGATHFLSKPYEPLDLLDLLGRLFDKK